MHSSKGQCKGPEAVTYLMCSRKDSAEASMAGAEGRKERREDSKEPAVR